MTGTDPSNRHQIRAEILVMGGLAAAIAGGGFGFYNIQKHDIEQDVHQHLREVVALKVAEIAEWRKERLGDARVATAAAMLSGDAAKEVEGQASPKMRQTVLAWLDSMRASYDYASVSITDKEGNIRAVSGELLGPADGYRALAKEVAESGEAVIREFAPGNGSTKPHLVLAAALNEAGGKRIGALLLGIDPAAYLYPKVLRWPTPTRTGQVILLRRDRGDVLFLSQLEGVPGSPMSLRRSLSNRASVSVRAALGETEVDGTIGAANGHAEQVEGAAGRVPDSDWFVLANMHADEAYERLGQIRRAIWIFGGMLLLLSCTGMEVIRRRQQSKFYRRLYEAEVEKQALRGQYDFLARFANDAIILVDTDNRIVEANDRATEYFGYTREELLSLDIRALRPPETRGQQPERWVALREKKSLIYELEMMRRDGVHLPAEVSTRLIEVEGRELAQSIIRDIGERKQAEAQIRRLNRLYLVLSRCGEAVIDAQSEQNLFERVCQVATEQGGLKSALVHMTDSGGHSTREVAHAGEEAGDLDRALAGGLGGGEGIANCNDVVDEAQAAPWKEQATQQGLRSWISLPLKRGGQKVGRLSLFSGESFFFNAEETALAQEIANSVSFALDAQERERLRRQAEANLSANRERLELVLDSTDEGYWDLDLVTGTSHQNARFSTMLGYESGTLESDFGTWESMVHPDDIPALRAAREAFERQDAFSVEVRVRCRPGGYIWCLCRGKVVARDGSGNPTRLVGTNTDITERKKLEEQFLQSQKLESVGRLAGGVAHDFNNLLTVINGYSALILARMNRADALRPMVEHIRGAGESAAGLTRQLLMFSRKELFEPKPLHLNATVDEARKMLGRLVGEDVEVITRLWASPDNVLADRNQIHQCIMNLVVNARDAMPGGGQLTIETINAMLQPADLLPETDTRSGPYVVLSVSDTGTGMDEQTRSRIFEPFFTTKETGKGTGLGLATVYGIVRQSGGFIRVESELNQGTSFRLYFPQTEAGEEREAPRNASLETGASETVLVVEDQKSLRAFLMELLTEQGYRVLQAGSGPEAIAAAQRHQGPIDLLLTDMVMPGMNGQDLARKLREMKPSIKVLFMSGYAGHAIGSTGAQEPPALLIQKPFTGDALMEKLREVLTASPSAASGE